MKSIRSLFYREIRLSARHYIIRLLLLVLVVGFAALSLLVTGQNSAHTGEDMSGFTVMLTYIIAVIAGVVIAEDNGVFKADIVVAEVSGHCHCDVAAREIVVCALNIFLGIIEKNA